jgi:hypothetical protein
MEQKHSCRSQGTLSAVPRLTRSQLAATLERQRTFFKGLISTYGDLEVTYSLAIEPDILHWTTFGACALLHEVVYSCEFWTGHLFLYCRVLSVCPVCVCL